MAGLELIDADAHVNPPPTFWDDYLPAAFKDRGPKIEEGAPGEAHDWVVFEGSRKPLNLQATTVGQGRNFRPNGRQSDVQAGSWEPAARLQDMSKDGVGRAVLFGGGPLGALDNDLYIASFDAYNRWLADFCAYDAKRLVGVAYLPMQDIDQSIAMLKDAAKRGLKAVNIPAFPQSKKGTAGGGFAAQVLALSGDPDGDLQYDNPEFDRFWQACVDHDMAITIHLGARVARPNMTRFLPNLVMSKLCMAEPISIMIFGGVFDRFPSLRFGSIESGVGWMSWMAKYMDDIYDNQRHWLQLDLKERPSFYMDQNVYGSFIRDPVGVLNRHLPGGKNIMWSTDYPHSETTWPDSLAVMAQQFGGLSEAEYRPIVHDNAIRFFGLAA
ncbi:amidohydrolase family protein [Sphingomonas montanisoli]|uniref:Amidohydrolase n=1 Tax=Sphingomonas montanisoli TaxID=2606412 RepID=A0A5D9CH00_9SPHN|nr:amidohydrolase family protein [Sphingomonas montanisoli]TZG29391.1 amidohydrolase [Sphingomonas montanisoli]